jgi:ankyrin repeat protein
LRSDFKGKRLHMLLIVSAILMCCLIVLRNPHASPPAEPGQTRKTGPQSASVRRHLANQSLLTAADFEMVPNAKIALDNGANIDARGLGGRTPLMSAARYGNVALTSLLLCHGASVNLKDGAGETAMTTAASGGYHKGDYLQVLRLLFQYGARVNMKNIFGDTALMDASSSCNAVTVYFLLNHGAKPDARDNDRETAISLALCQNNSIRVVQLLRQHGVRLPKASLNEALLAVASFGDPGSIKWLLRLGADVNTKNYLNHTVLMSAAVGGNTPVVGMLLDKGVNVNVVERCDAEASNIGGTALQQAESARQYDVVKILTQAGGR